jgi:hypothetical protein
MVYEKLRAALKQSIEEDGVGVILDTLCIIFREDYPHRKDMEILSKYLFHANGVYHSTDENTGLLTVNYEDDDDDKEV